MRMSRSLSRSLLRGEVFRVSCVSPVCALCRPPCFCFSSRVLSFPFWQYVLKATCYMLLATPVLLFLSVDVLCVLLRVVAPCTRLSSLSRQCWIVTSYKGFSSAAEISSELPEIGRNLLATGECNILKT
ncbi:unnamed protein product [Ixodes persulcatus]